MGFAQGFGQAFSESYTLGTQLRKREESDMFDKIWSTYEKNREKREEAEKNDSRIAGAARQIAGRYGQPVAPIMDALKSGLSVEYVDDMAQSGTWRRSDGDGLNPTTPTPEAPEVTQTQAVQGEDEGAGLAQREAPTSSQPTGIPNNPAYRASIGRAAEAAGVSEDEFQQGLTYTPPAQSETVSMGYEYLAKPEPMKLDDRRDQLTLLYNQAVQSGDQEAAASYRAELSNIGEATALSSGRPDRPDSEAGLIQKIVVDSQSVDPTVRANAENSLRLLTQIETLRAGLQSDAQGNSMTVVTPEGEYVSVMPNRTLEGTTFVDRQGNQVQGAPVSPQEAESGAVLLAMPTEKPVAEYNAQLPQVASFVKLSSDLANIVEQSQQLGNPVTTSASGVAELANRVSEEVSSGLNLIDTQLRGNLRVGQVFDSGGIDSSALAEIDSELDGLLSQGIRDTGELKAIFEAKKRLLVYRLGMANEQAGRAFTEQDRAQFEGILNASVKPDAFLQNLAQLNKDTIFDMNNRAVALNNDPRIQNHLNQYGTTPLPDNRIVPDVESFLVQANETAGGQGLPPYLDFIDKYSTEPAQARQAPQPQGQGGLQVGHTEDGYRYIGGDPGDPNSWEQTGN